MTFSAYFPVFFILAILASKAIGFPLEERLSEQRLVYELKNQEPNLLDERQLNTETKMTLEDFTVGYKVIQIDKETPVRTFYEHFVLEMGGGSERFEAVTVKLRFQSLAEESQLVTVDNLKTDSEFIILNVWNPENSKKAHLGKPINLPFAVRGSDSQSIEFTYVPLEPGVYTHSIYVIYHLSWPDSCNKFMHQTEKKVHQFTFYAEVKENSAFFYDYWYKERFLTTHSYFQTVSLENKHNSEPLVLRNLESFFGFLPFDATKKNSNECHSAFQRECKPKLGNVVEIKPKSKGIIWEISYDSSLLDFRQFLKGYVRFEVDNGILKRYAVHYFFYTGFMEVYFPMNELSMGLLVRDEVIHEFPLIIGNFGWDNVTVNDLKLDYYQTGPMRLCWCPRQRGKVRVPAQSEVVIGSFFVVANTVAVAHYSNFLRGAIRLFVSKSSEKSSFYQFTIAAGHDPQDMTAQPNSLDIMVDIKKGKTNDWRTNTDYSFEPDGSVIIKKDLEILNHYPLLLAPRTVESDLNFRWAKDKVVEPYKKQILGTFNIRVPKEQVGQLEYEKHYVKLKIFGKVQVGLPIVFVDMKLQCNYLKNNVRIIEKCSRLGAYQMNLGRLRESSVHHETVVMFNPFNYEIKFDYPLENPNINIEIFYSSVTELRLNNRQKVLPNNTFPTHLGPKSMVSLFFKIIVEPGPSLGLVTKRDISVISVYEEFQFVIKYHRYSGFLSLATNVSKEIETQFSGLDNNVYVNLSVQNTFNVDVDVVSIQNENKDLKLQLLSTTIPALKTWPLVQIQTNFLDILHTNNRQREILNSRIFSTTELLFFNTIYIYDLKLNQRANFILRFGLKTSIQEDFLVSEMVSIPFPSLFSQDEITITSQGLFQLQTQSVRITNPFRLPLEFECFLIYGDTLDLIRKQKYPEDMTVLDIYDYSSNQPNRAVLNKEANPKQLPIAFKSSFPFVELTGNRSLLFLCLDWLWKLSTGSEFLTQHQVNKKKEWELRKLLLAIDVGSISRERGWRTAEDLNQIQNLIQKVVGSSKDDEESKLEYLVTDRKERLEKQEIFMNQSFFQKTKVLRPYQTILLPILSYYPTSAEGSSALLVIKNNITQSELLPIYGKLKIPDLRMYLVPIDSSKIPNKDMNSKLIDITELFPESFSFDNATYEREIEFFVENNGVHDGKIFVFLVNGKECSDGILSIRECDPNHEFSVLPNTSISVTLKIYIRHEDIVPDVSSIEMFGAGIYQRLELKLKEGVYFSKDHLRFENILSTLALIMGLCIVIYCYFLVQNEWGASSSEFMPLKNIEKGKKLFRNKKRSAQDGSKSWRKDQKEEKNDKERKKSLTKRDNLLEEKDSKIEAAHEKKPAIKYIEEKMSKFAGEIDLITENALEKGKGKFKSDEEEENSEENGSYEKKEQDAQEAYEFKAKQTKEETEKRNKFEEENSKNEEELEQEMKSEGFDENQSGLIPFEFNYLHPENPQNEEFEREISGQSSISRGDLSGLQIVSHRSLPIAIEGRFKEEKRSILFENQSESRPISKQKSLLELIEPEIKESSRSPFHEEQENEKLDWPKEQDIVLNQIIDNENEPERPKVVLISSSNSKSPGHKSQSKEIQNPASTHSSLWHQNSLLDMISPGGLHSQLNQNNESDIKNLSERKKRKKKKSKAVDWVPKSLTGSDSSSIILKKPIKARKQRKTEKDEMKNPREPRLEPGTKKEVVKSAQKVERIPSPKRKESEFREDHEKIESKAKKNQTETSSEEENLIQFSRIPRNTFPKEEKAKTPVEIISQTSHKKFDEDVQVKKEEKDQEPKNKSPSSSSDPIYEEFKKDAQELDESDSKLTSGQGYIGERKGFGFASPIDTSESSRKGAILVANKFKLGKSPKKKKEEPMNFFQSRESSESENISNSSSPAGRKAFYSRLTQGMALQNRPRMRPGGLLMDSESMQSDSENQTIGLVGLPVLQRNFQTTYFNPFSITKLEMGNPKDEEEEKEEPEGKELISKRPPGL